MRSSSPVLLIASALLAACSSSSTSSRPPADGPRPEVIETVSPAPASTGERREPPYFEFQVETPVRARRGGCAPTLPEELRQPGNKGTTIGQFIVDTAGVPEPQSFKVIRETHASYSAAVREALPCMRFSPATIRGRRVRQLVQQPFVFDVRK